MALVIESNKKFRQYQANNMARVGSFAVISGCLVSPDAPTSMNVDVASGVIQEGVTQAVVTGGLLAISAADLTDYRYDLVLCDTSGTTSILTGTPDPQATVLPPAYDPDLYIVLAAVLVEPAVTTIEASALEDTRIFNTLTDSDTGDTFIDELHSELQAGVTERPTSGLLGLNPTIDFSDVEKQSVFFSIPIPAHLDTGSDIFFKIRYVMSVANTSDAVYLTLEANSLADGEDGTPGASQATNNQTITVPNTAEEVDVVTTTTLKIPNSIISAGDLLSVKISRDATNVADTAAGFFKLLSIEEVYTSL